MVQQFEDKSIVKWTPEATQAWEAIQFFVAEAPLLYSPTINGKFCDTSDGSMIALGGALYPLESKNFHVFQLTRS